MRLVSTIIAVVMALSVALLPVGSLAAPMSAGLQDRCADMLSSPDASPGVVTAMPHCCSGSDLCGAQPQQSGDQCGPMSACAGHPANMAAAGSMQAALRAPAATALAFPPDQIVPSRSGFPPFRPPCA